MLLEIATNPVATWEVLRGNGDRLWETMQTPEYQGRSAALDGGMMIASLGTQSLGRLAVRGATRFAQKMVRQAAHQAAKFSSKRALRLAGNATNKIDDVLALPGPRQVDFNMGAVNNYRHGGQMSAIEHINYRHAYESGFENVSRFSQGTSARNISNYIDEASRYGTVTPQGANGFKIEYDFGRAIGTNQAGDAATQLRIFIRDGNLQTAFPF